MYCVWPGIQVCVHKCVHAFGGQKSVVNIFLNGSPSYFFFKDKILPLSLFASSCCDKPHDQKQLGEERAYLSLQCTVLHRGKSGQELKQKPGSRH